MHTGLIGTLEREALPITVAAIGLFLFGLGLRLGLTRLPAVLETRSEAIHYQALVKNSDNYRELRARIEERNQALARRLSELTQGIRDARELSGMLQMIFDEAFKVGLRLDRTEPQEELVGTDFIEYPVHLETTSTYHKIAAFISALERKPQVVRVDRLSMAAVGGGSVEARLMITCYVGKGE